MKLTFRIRFATQMGQSLWLDAKELSDEAVPLQYRDPASWQASVSLSDAAVKKTINYNYLLQQPDGELLADWGRDRSIKPAEFNCDELLVVDSWNHPGYVENTFYTAPFKKVFMAENFTAIRTTAPANPTHTFRVKSPLLAKGQTLCLVGEGNTLGNWNTHAPLLLGRHQDEGYFSAKVDLRGRIYPLAYKYGVFDVERNVFICYEDGPNRMLSDESAAGRHTLVNDGYVRLPLKPWRGAGVAVPVFSLRTERSFGVGEFTDLKLLADWGKKVGLKIIQLLPVNDTNASGTWKDSYPYAAISAFALHPIYLNLDAVAEKAGKSKLRSLETTRRRLNALETVDYESVMKAKLTFLRNIFCAQKTATLRSKAYKKFFTQNQYWLEPYAAFCFLRDKFGTADFSRWPEHHIYDAKKIAALARNQDSITFYCFLQYHLHRQLQEVAQYVHDAGMVLKGDIAIGVARHGADTWQQPELFHMDMQAGAPPDPFSAIGQNWGFPTYNWPRMADDGFAWWKQRFAQMGNYFDAFRIDHILGFFRIWSLPTHAVQGLMGYFVPAIPIVYGELAVRGIHVPLKRLTQPFITEAVIEEFFGREARWVRKQFLTEDEEGNYCLKPEYTTQQQLEQFFGSSPQARRRMKLKAGMFTLASNVILLESAGRMHFRFFMDQTSSFKHLPAEVQPKLRDLYVDYFFRRQESLWRSEGLEILPALKRVTNMLICGEDLGLVPACVPEVMRHLGLLSLEIQRMPKAMGVDFSRPADAPYLSVVTPSTHDMSTLRGWWREDKALSQKFYTSELGQPGEAPSEATPEIVERIVQQHLQSPAMWSIFQMQDLLGMSHKLRRRQIDAERINVPANPNFYWRYRLHLPLEKLLQEETFNTQLTRLVKTAGR